jgi:hypothetical protein
MPVSGSTPTYARSGSALISVSGSESVSVRVIYSQSCDYYVQFCSNQILLRFKLRKDRKIKILFLLKLEIKVCRMITGRYIYFNPLQKTINIILLLT